MSGPDSRPSNEAIAAIRAWYRLDRAFAAANAELQRNHHITGEQLGILRIVAERDRWPLSDLRARMTMHPATLGQVLGRLADKDLVTIRADDDDARRRLITLTEHGRATLAAAPVAGPVRLRSTTASPAELRRLAESFLEAIELFGLQQWDPGERPGQRG